MSRITKKHKQKRIKQGDKIRRRGVSAIHMTTHWRCWRLDWQLLPQHVKQLYRLRANQAMSVFAEDK